MILTFRPIDHWDGAETRSRQSSNFKASYSTTLALLERELDMLRARHPVLMVDGTEDDCRLDGQLRASARLRSPRVILAFESKHGPLKYPCDRFTFWQDNLRAIALALEALRKVERYGVTSRGEQYTGWRQLPAGSVELGASLTRQDAWDTLIDLGTGLGYPPNVEAATDEMIADLYRMAAKLHHPDTGGDGETFNRANRARERLNGVHGR